MMGSKYVTFTTNDVQSACGCVVQDVKVSLANMLSDFLNEYIGLLVEYRQKWPTDLITEWHWHLLTLGPPNMGLKVLNFIKHFSHISKKLNITKESCSHTRSCKESNTSIEETINITFFDASFGTQNHLNVIRMIDEQETFWAKPSNEWSRLFHHILHNLHHFLEGSKRSKFGINYDFAFTS